MIPDPLPDERQGEGFWGDSVLDSLMDAVMNVGVTSQAVAHMLQEASVDVIKIRDFLQSVRDDEYRKALIERFSLANIAKSSVNALILDADDEWGRMEQRFGGVRDVMMVYLLIASGAADIPATRMLGQSPTGLSATGESDLRNYYDNVHVRQTLDIEPAIMNLDRCLVRSALGDWPDGLSYEWKSLWQPDAYGGGRDGAEESPSLPGRRQFRAVLRRSPPAGEGRPDRGRRPLPRFRRDTGGARRFRFRHGGGRSRRRKTTPRRKPSSVANDVDPTGTGRARRRYRKELESRLNYGIRRDILKAVTAAATYSVSATPLCRKLRIRHLPGQARRLRRRGWTSACWNGFLTAEEGTGMYGAWNGYWDQYVDSGLQERRPRRLRRTWGRKGPLAAVLSGPVHVNKLEQIYTRNFAALKKRLRSHVGAAVRDPGARPRRRYRPGSPGAAAGRQGGQGRHHPRARCLRKQR